MIKGNYNIGLVPDFYRYPAVKDGIYVYSYELISSMIKLNPDMHFTIFIGDKYCSLFANLSGNYRIAKLKYIDKTRVINIFSYIFEIPYIAKKNRVDLLHLFSGNRRLSLFMAEQSIITIHDIYNYYNKEIYNLNRFIYCKLLLLIFLKRYKNIIAISDNTASEIKNKFSIHPERLKVIENGYNSSLFKKNDNLTMFNQIKMKYKLKKPFMLYVSVLDYPRKNHIRLIKAYNALCRINPCLPDLIFVGEKYWNEELIYKEIEKYSLARKIRPLGYVPDEDLAVLYNNAKLFIHPSLYEGFGLPLIESMACGLPVICSDIPIFREVGGNAAVFFNPYNPDDMADKIQLLLSNEGLYLKYRNKGLEKAKMYSWNKTARTVISLYNEILNSKKPINFR